MAQGRCAGCGLIDNSSTKIRQHVVSCPDYLKLFKTTPERALEPAAEFVRWQAEDNTKEQRAEAKDTRLAKKFAELDQRRVNQVARWVTPPDILD